MGRFVSERPTAAHLANLGERPLLADEPPFARSTCRRHELLFFGSEFGKSGNSRASRAFAKGIQKSRLDTGRLSLQYPALCISLSKTERALLNNARFGSLGSPPCGKFLLKIRRFRIAPELPIFQISFWPE